MPRYFDWVYQEFISGGEMRTEYTLACAQRALKHGDIERARALLLLGLRGQQSHHADRLKTLLKEIEK